jgi:hypothetical protein
MPHYLSIEGARVLCAALPLKGNLFNVHGNPLFVKSEPIAALLQMSEAEIQRSMKRLKTMGLLE